MSAAYLAESRKTSERWVYSGRMVRRDDEPRQLLPSAFRSTLLPLLKCKREFGIANSLFLVHYTLNVNDLLFKITVVFKFSLKPLQMSLSVY